MDSKPSSVAKIRATPAKLALMGVLGVVFVVVLYVQFGGSNEHMPPDAEDLSVQQRPNVDRAEVRQEHNQAAAETPLQGGMASSYSKWRPPELPSVIQYDPFALPASFPQPPPAGVDATLAEMGDPSSGEAAENLASLEQQMQQSRSELEALRRLGVQVIMRQDNGYVAMIGDQTIHVGDEINGFTVIAIDSDGVRVARDINP